MSAEAFLKQWAVVTEQLTRVVDTALDVEPPGGLSEAWQEVLGTFEVAALSEDARLHEVLQAKQTRGAPVSEVRACVEALARGAATSLAPLRGLLNGAQAALVDQSLHTFAAQALEHYRLKATEKKKRMFGAAKALAAQHQYGGAAASVGYVLTCVTCRAPRLGEALTCAFCGGALEATS